MSDIFGNVKGFVRGRIEGRAHEVGSRFLRLADALRSTVSNEQPRETGVVDDAGASIANQLERAGKYLNETSIERAFSDLESTARRGPLTFSAASFVLGFALTRFLKASSSS